MTDIKLIEACRGGDPGNFRRLVEETSPFAFSVAFRLLGNEDQAKDVVQETMVTVWQKISKIKSAEGYRTWIYRIVVNRCYDELRRRKRNPEFSPDEKAWALISDTIAGRSDSNLENKEIAGIIDALSKRLSPRQKMVFILSDIEQLNGDEIAAITGMNKLQVKANLHYARKNISEMLGKYLQQ